jgi:glycine oxidase
MSGLSARRVIVVGAGALGWSIALVLAQGGARVRLVDCAAPGDNASGVAAGMLAPAFEALLDPLSAEHFPLLRQARDLWPEFAERLDDDIGLRRCGAIWVDAAAAGAEACAAGLSRLGARAERLSAKAMKTFAPGLDPHAGEGVFTPDDWRLEAGAALSAIARAGGCAGVETVAARLAAIVAGAAMLEDGRRLETDAIVLATGAGRTPLAPELARLSPIKGHILQYAWPMAVSTSPILRSPGGYGVVGEGGVRVGATMQAGRYDRCIEPPVAAQLHALAASLFPALANATATPAAGVRAATPDGLPLVGPSVLPGVFLAVGARRNGWLLAPQVAAMVAAYVAGEDPGPRAPLFDPRRFD